MAKSRPLKRYLIVFLVIIAAVAGWQYFRPGGKNTPVFTTATVERGAVTQVVTATGTLQPVTSVEVGSQVSGLITEVLVDFNTPVKAGQLLARIDPATYEQRLRQAEAELASSKANHVLLTLNTVRTRELRERNLVSQQELDQAEATLAQADANLLTREASVENARVDLSRCSIYSPVDGIVLDRKIEVGRTVAASLNAPVLFIIADDLSRMQINAAIAEADIGSVEDGQRVDFTVDAYPDRRFRGRVIQIRNSPKTESNVVTYQTIIEVRNDDLRLKPGMTANVSVVIADRPDTLRIPNSTLRVRIPDSLLPPAPPLSSGSDTSAPVSEEDKLRQLYADAGFTPGSGPPSPEVRARLTRLAQERGIDLSALRRGGRGREGAAPAQISTRTVYKLTGTATQPTIEAVNIRLGISDGISTELIEGLAEGDQLITSAYIPGQNATGSMPANNPFTGTRRRF